MDSIHPLGVLLIGACGNVYWDDLAVFFVNGIVDVLFIMANLVDTVNPQWKHSKNVAFFTVYQVFRK